MPMHDWSRVDAMLFRAFRASLAFGTLSSFESTVLTEG